MFLHAQLEFEFHDKLKRLCYLKIDETASSLVLNKECFKMPISFNGYTPQRFTNDSRFTGAFKDRKEAQNRSIDGQIDSFGFGRSTVYVVNSRGTGTVGADYKGGHDYDGYQAAKAQGGKKLKQIKTKLWTYAVINVPIFGYDDLNRYQKS
jgi:hypothetical protein